MIRLGISMYGYYPSAQVSRERVRLRPALTLKTRIIHRSVLLPGQVSVTERR